LFNIHVYHSEVLQYKFNVKNHISQTRPSLIVFTYDYNIRATCFYLWWVIFRPS